MSVPSDRLQASGESLFRETADLLGLKAAGGRRAKTPLEIHEMLLGGLPGRSVLALRRHLKTLAWEGPLALATGMSLRTVQRLEESKGKPLSYEQSSRTWKFAEVLSKATSVLGTQDAAERWLERPAKGLDGRRPIDLLATQTGTQLVEDFLERLDYGVYV